MDSRKPPLMTILADHPAHEREGDGDQIGLEPRLAAVYDILRHKETRCPITIAIYGDWGTGKSSAMRWLMAKLDEWNDDNRTKDRDGHPRVYPVWFDPWKYHSREDVWRGIIAEVILKVFDAKELDTGNFQTRIKEAAKQFGSFLGKGFLHALANTKLKLGKGAELEVSGVAFRDIFEEFEKTNRPEKAFLNRFEGSLQKWVIGFLGPDARLCLFIDDLDRCLPDVTLEVLEALKLYLNIPQLVFVVGLDRTVVDGVVRKHYRKEMLSENQSDQTMADMKASRYLDKIFQVEVHIAPSETQVAEKYFGIQIKKLNQRTNNYWDNMLDGEGHKVPIEAMILRVAEHNPREIKRLLNSALGSGREAAERIELDGTVKVRFSQGAQVYLLFRFVQFMLKDRTANNLLRTRQNVDKFAKLAKYFRNHPDESKLEMDLTNVKGFAGDTEYKKLMDDLPHADDEQDLPQVIFQDQHLKALLRIPFSTPVAQAAAPVGTESVPVEQAAPYTVAQAAPKLPPVLAKKLKGVDFTRITELDLSDSEIQDADFVHLAPLTQLRLLSFDRGQVSDTGLAYLKGLTQLKALSFNETQVGDAGIAHLEGLTQLQGLSLRGTQVGDAGLVHLAALTQLKNLWLDKTQVGDAGLAHLKGLTQLRGLFLNGIQVGDAGLAHLVALTQLQELSLIETQVGDAGLVHLAALTQLKNLWLDRTQVGDAGLAHLKSLTQLRGLWLKETQVTKAGMEALQNHHLRKCEIHS